MASDDAEQKLATDDEREEYHIKIELLRNKEKERTELMDNMKRKTYVTVALSLVSPYPPRRRVLTQPLWCRLVAQQLRAPYGTCK